MKVPNDCARTGTYFVFIAFIAFIASIACSESATAILDASVESAEATDQDANFSPFEAGADTSADPGPPDAADPPLILCGDAGADASADAGDGGDCPLPPSICADSMWLVYYDNPMCVMGACHYDKKFLQCKWQATCVGGGCIGGPTNAPPP